MFGDTQAESGAQPAAVLDGLPRAHAEPVDTMIAVAVGALAAVFVGALILLLLLCHRYKLASSMLGWGYSHVQQEGRAAPEVELGEVCLHPDLEGVLADQEWLCDATGLIPHCLDVLKLCHRLANGLLHLARGGLASPRAEREIVEVTRRITPRVDDMINSMYPPLDARLLEARTAALILAVTHLAFVTRQAVSGRADWIDDCLARMERHLLALREAALTQEAACRIQKIIDH
ncbi:transmembrane protein 98-like [Bacillus rossius redtenbacheri]|uniref:transmembrane protein 98-like n=1 Tax=Bacillus rossius redtenbacheri TaxID=93214 RepID=UPI002FDD5EDA